MPPLGRPTAGDVQGFFGHRQNTRHACDVRHHLNGQDRTGTSHIDILGGRSADQLGVHVFADVLAVWQGFAVRLPNDDLGIVRPPLIIGVVPSDYFAGVVAGWCRGPGNLDKVDAVTWLADKCFIACAKFVCQPAAFKVAQHGGQPFG